MRTPILEICVDAPASIAAAVLGGADRLELCSALALGGLTPGFGLVKAALATGIPVAAMARPHGGGFVLQGGDLAAVLEDIRALASMQVDAIVCGASLPEGTLDEAALRAMIAAAGAVPVILHRVIDLAPDWQEALDVAIALGIQRVLTSGGPGPATDGALQLKAMVAHAAGRIEIMAGGGIRPEHVEPLCGTGVDAIHGSASTVTETNGADRIGVPPHAQSDAAIVAKMRAALVKTASAA